MPVLINWSEVGVRHTMCRNRLRKDCKENSNLQRSGCRVAQTRAECCYGRIKARTKRVQLKVRCDPCTCTCRRKLGPGWNDATTVFRRGQNECSRRFTASHAHAHAHARACADQVVMMLRPYFVADKTIVAEDSLRAMHMHMQEHAQTRL
ncbi:hypothetical protein J6590_042509 [Homalodisca vitripennis]|nr:hypothetical protein J6590_042509 [Homalodisca vitripennis]